MSLVLRDYQVKLIDDTRAALRRSKRVVAQLPTGGGKTALSTEMLKRVISKGARGMFSVHRQELIDQTMRTFAEFDLPYGVISSGFPEAPREPIQIASIDTLRARLQRNPKSIVRPDFLVVDECHHAAAGGWSFVLQHFAGCQIVGLTATPKRLDGRPLRGLFDEMVCGPSTAELIERGYLSRYRPFMPSVPDLGGVVTQMGDYNKRQLGGAMDKPAITGDAISHYLRLASGRRALAFCVSIDHSKHVVQQFREAGVVAYHLDGETNRGERREAIAAFRRGDIKVLSNVDLFGEGFDVPAAEVSIMLRPTKSLSLYLQQCGRVLRPLEGKAPAILLDHAGNIARHGLPCDEREWTLDGEVKTKKKPGEVSVKNCPRCFFVHPIGRPKCPECGFVYTKQGRDVEQKDGVLNEVVDVDERRAEQLKLALEKKGENARARSLEDLINLGRARGYREPEKWAAHLMTARGMNKLQVQNMLVAFLKEEGGPHSMKKLSELFGVKA